MIEISCHKFTAAQLKASPRCRFASHISQRRVKLKMRQEELARRVGLSRTSITNMEAGKQGIKADELPRWAKALSWSVRDLAKGLEYKHE